MSRLAVSSAETLPTRWRATLDLWLSGRGPALAWLSVPGMALAVWAMCLPFALVQVPPLVDVAGHMGAAAIEAALEQGGANTPLGHYFGWNWVFTLNIGGDVLMKVLGEHFGILAAGWWSTVLGTALFAGGGLATIRLLNPRGGHGAAWALVWVFSFPLLTGFLNYILATGLALSVFAGALALERRPIVRAVLLIVAQPLAMLCHAIGGLLVALLVGTEAFGRMLDELPAGWWRPSELAALWRDGTLRRSVVTLLVRCWPLLATVITIVLWREFSPPVRSLNTWRWDQKEWYLTLSLRDQSETLDMATTFSCYALVLLGWVIGARWRWRQVLPGLAVLMVFVAIPSDINGSAFVDVRLLPVAVMLLLGLEDWSAAHARVRLAVAWLGLVVLGLRLTVTAASFADYAADYGRQLEALNHVAPGSRVLAFVEHTCLNESWRNARTDHIASLASLYRQAWVNDNWAVPGLHMLQPRFRPSRWFFADPSEFVWSRRCAGGRLRSIDGAMRYAPVERVDYVWLIDTGLPENPDPRLTLVWSEGRSFLFAVRPLAFPAFAPKDL